MAKTKRKSHNEVEHMRGMLREYEKQIRSLQKQVRSYEKFEQRSQDTEIDTSSEDTIVDLKMVKDCESCGKSKMVETLNLGGNRIYGECNLCGHKGKMT